MLSGRAEAPQLRREQQVEFDKPFPLPQRIGIPLKDRSVNSNCQSLGRRVKIALREEYPLMGLLLMRHLSLVGHDHPFDQMKNRDNPASRNKPPCGFIPDAITYLSTSWMSLPVRGGFRVCGRRRFMVMPAEKTRVTYFACWQCLCSLVCKKW